MTGDEAVLRLTGMRFFGSIGHSPEEREVGAHVEVDVELVIGLEPGPVHALERTVDYREVHERVERVVESGEHPLLEGLAGEVLDALEGLGWKTATVRVRKEAPPMGGNVRHAEIEVTRSG